MNQGKIQIFKILNKYRKIYQIQKITLRLRGAKIGVGNTFNGWLVVANPELLAIGNHNVFNEYVYINARGGVEIGSNCHFSVFSKIISTRLLSDHSSHISRKIIIKDDVWMAANSTIAVSQSDVIVTSKVTLAANSYLDKNILNSGIYFNKEKFKTLEEGD